jgi:hypothetical protein
VTACPAVLSQEVFDLGKGEWSNPDGCGSGEGQLVLRITYTPFDGFTKHPSRAANVRFTLNPKP